MLRRSALVVMMALLSCGCRKVAKKKTWTEDTVPVKVEFWLVEEGAGQNLTLDDLEKKVPLNNTHIEDAYFGTNEIGAPYVSLRMTADGAKANMNLTANNIGKRVAIVGNGKILCAPVIQVAVAAPVVQITNTDFTKEKTEALAAGIMKYNALNPVE